ncbi:MAG: PepSY domain-containing protein [Acidimicrobiia bacterium]|nr:PepSY domain-containing protein [Acidimicrobiia bacterium]
MKNRTKILLGVVVLAAVAAWPVTAIAGGDSDTPITGPALQQASDAALNHLGEGIVTDTEVGDEESLYEVEVTLPDGREVDVQLDENFNVVGSEPESPDKNDTDGS